MTMKDFFREENGEVIPLDEGVLIDFKDGDIVEGEVVRIDRDEVLVDIGYKSEGLIPSNELTIRKGADPHDVVDLQPRLRSLGADMLMQVHDELVFDVDEERVDEVAELVAERMVAAYDLHPPLEVEAKVGERWGRVRPWSVV